MGLVIGAFTTLAEAERAARALLDAGFAAERMTAVARLGSGRLRLAERIAVHPVAEPARLVNRTERAGRSALLGGALGALLAAAIVVLLLRMGVEPLAPLLLAGAVLLGGACAGGLAALARRGTGLPHDLAFRYSLRLDQGDIVLAVATANASEARSAQETLALHGAILAHVTRGTLEAVEDPPATAGLAASGRG